MKEHQLKRVNAPALAHIVDRNIELIAASRAEANQQRSPQIRIADGITRFSGSMSFVYLHVVWFVAWIGLSFGLLSIKPFDPFPYSLLTMIVSLEAIFLSTFVLVSQNRQAGLADRRADLDLQINLLAEYEITRLLKLTVAITKHLNIEENQDPELAELKENIDPETVLHEIEDREKEKKKAPGKAKKSE